MGRNRKLPCGGRLKRFLSPAALCLFLGCRPTAFDTSSRNPDPALVRSLFREIQDSVFDPICIRCHAGATAPQTLVLTSDRSGEIVGKESTEKIGILLVKPGDPENSYLIWKLEGRGGIEGLRMPFLMPPLAPEQVELFRQWIRRL